MRPFVDRVREMGLLAGALADDGAGSPVLVFTGIGGMGKTALRMAFEEQVLKPGRVPHATVDFDGDPGLRPIEATLRAVRRQLGRAGVKAPVFDYLYARYFELSTGIKLSAAGSLPPELEGVATILGGLPGIGSVAQILQGLTKLGLVVRERLQHKEWLYRLRDLEPRDILQLLPEVLAEDLEEMQSVQALPALKSSGARMVVLFDGYERLAEVQTDDTLHRKLLLLTPRLLRVVFTRDALVWEQKYPSEWSGKIRHLPALEVLPAEDARAFLLEKGVDDAELQQYLCGLAGGYPLHLELGADICREVAEATGRRPGVQDFEGAAEAKNLTGDLVERLLRQLRDDERDLMRLAVYPRWITEEILAELSSVPESVPRIFQRFRGFSIFSPHPAIPGACVVRREVREYLLGPQRKLRQWRKRHETLARYHHECWAEFKEPRHLREALYHGCHVDAAGALKLFEEQFQERLGRFDLNEAESLLAAVPPETLSAEQRRTTDYARARLLHEGSRSKDQLTAAKSIYEGLAALETNERRLADCLAHLGEVAGLLAEYEKSLEYNLKVLELRRKLDGDSAPGVAASLHGIGRVYARMQKSAEALDYFRQSLAIRRRAFGEDEEGAEVAALLSNTGVAQCERGEYREALESYERSLRIREKVLGPEHPQVGICLSNIGDLYRRMGDLDRALEFVRRAMAVWGRSYGEGHPQLAIAHYNLGLICYFRGDCAGALEQLEEALSVRLATLGGEHPLVADTYTAIGVVYWAKGDLDRALENNGKGRAILVRNLGEAHPHVAGSYLNDGLICRAKHDYEGSLRCLREASTRLQKLLGTKHPEVANSHAAIAETLNEMGRREEAMAEARLAAGTYADLGMGTPEADVLEKLAGWLADEGRDEEAERARSQARTARASHVPP